MYYVMYSNEDGEWMENPEYTMLGRSGNSWVIPDRSEMIPLPSGSSLVTIPGYFPVGLGNNDEAICINNDPYNPDKKAEVVAALLPQGFTRTLLPACIPRCSQGTIPLLGYTAVGFRGGKVYAAAVQSDRHHSWHPRFYNTEQLSSRIHRMLQRFPHNRILRQLAKCSLQYGCFTAQNLFYQRWEAGIPTTPACNANCLGCISEPHETAESPQHRLDFVPTAEEIVELAVEHLNHAPRAIISFGQGCEGEPSLNADLLAEAIKQIRARTPKGTININTHGGNERQLSKMFEAGLDAMRVTMFSLVEKHYELYHRPYNYSLGQVLSTIKRALDRNIQVSLNLLVLPGFTDGPEEVEALLRFVEDYPLHMIQLRNLNIDPEVINRHVGFQGNALGITTMLGMLQKEAPHVRLGSYTHGVRE